MFCLKKSSFLFNRYFAVKMYSTVTINHPKKSDPEFTKILTDDALKFLNLLHLKFNDKRKDLLELRLKRKEDLRTGSKLGFLDSTKHIRDDKSWKIAQLPDDLLKRHVEITGPVDRKMVINALNSGADCFMADFEDSNSPTFTNQINGQINLRDAINREIDFEIKGKQYKLSDNPATLIVRPRGWHLAEKHLRVNNEEMSGSLVDFGLYFYHNAKNLIKKNTGPYFYLPKMESHLEARLWNEIFKFSQDYLDIKQGTIKATCLIETLPLIFETQEVLYELKEHSAGLNAGRWDYIFSCIKTYQNDPEFVLADRSLLTMETPFMRSYALQLIKACHERNAPAIGGMSALIPIKNDPVANEKALNGVRLDKRRDARDGYDGGWIAHPGLQTIARDEFSKVLGDKNNQIDVKREDIKYDEQSLLDFRPKAPITMNGLRVNASVAIQYLGSWLNGNGCVPINNLMEDAATAEISRAQIWNWIKSKHGVLDNGQKITKELVQQVINEELNKIEQNNKNNLPYRKAAEIFEKMTKNDRLDDFLTIPLYKHL